MSSTDATDSAALSVPPPPPPAESPRRLASPGMFASGLAPIVRPPNDLDRMKLVEEACTQSWKVFGQQASDEESPEAISLLSLYNHCDAVMQSGPTCGLVALIMCLKLVKSELETTLGDVLRQAQSLGYTKLGEMFSVTGMSQFIQQTFGVKAERREWLEMSRLPVVEHLCHGLPLLVPYDADANYEPCLKGGKRAHWAAICGFCIIIPSANSSVPITDGLQEDFCKVIPLGDNRSLIHVKPGPHSGKPSLQFKFVKEHLASRGNLFVYARQGKSRRIQIWNYDQLCKSNRNLSKVSSKILDNPQRTEMIYPENGDLTKSLANQFLFVYK